MSTPGWEAVKLRHLIGSTVEGTVARVYPYGVWVKFDHEFAGLMMIPGAGVKPDEDLIVHYPVASAVAAKVIWHDDERQQFVLSRRAN